MTDDVRRVIYTTVVIFVVGVIFWIAFLFVSACGFTLTCNQAQPAILATAIPTIGHAPAPAFVSQDTSGKCQVRATDVLGAWVIAGSSETESFTFNDVNGNACQGNFADDVRPLFVEGNIWYPGSYSCTSCHNADIGKTSVANLDLTSYEGIMSGSQRVSLDVSGTDILGEGDWEQSLLYEFTVNHPPLPPGHAETATGETPLVFAGEANPAAATGAPTVTPTP
jgi:hypothetical protein